MGTRTPGTAGRNTTDHGPLHPRSVARGAADRPASSVGIVGAALVIIANKFGAGLTADDGVVIVAAAAKIAEWLVERFGSGSR